MAGLCPLGSTDSFGESLFAATDCLTLGHRFNSLYLCNERIALPPGLREGTSRGALGTTVLSAWWPQPQPSNLQFSITLLIRVIKSSLSNSWSTFVRAILDISARSRGCVTRYEMASATSSTDPGLTTKPLTPCVTISELPPTFVTMQGSPQAIASGIESGNPSRCEVSTKAVPARKYGLTSSWNPSKKTWPHKPNSKACSDSSSLRGPSPTMMHLQRTPPRNTRAIASSRMSIRFCSLSLATQTRTNSSGPSPSLTLRSSRLSSCRSNSDKDMPL